MFYHDLIGSHLVTRYCSSLSYKRETSSLSSSSIIQQTSTQPHLLPIQPQTNQTATNPSSVSLIYIILVYFAVFPCLCTTATYPAMLKCTMASQSCHKVPDPIFEYLLIHFQLTVGKTNKFNDRDHAAIADGMHFIHLVEPLLSGISLSAANS